MVLKKPKTPKLKIVKHGSGYQVFDGRRKLSPTTSLSLAVEVVKSAERTYLKHRQMWAKSKLSVKRK